MNEKTLQLVTKEEEMKGMEEEKKNLIRQFEQLQLELQESQIAVQTVEETLAVSQTQVKFYCSQFAWDFAKYHIKKQRLNGVKMIINQYGFGFLQVLKSESMVVQNLGHQEIYSIGICRSAPNNCHY